MNMRQMLNREAGGGVGDHFQKGEEVEVCFDERGFRGSWYHATVIRTFKLSTVNRNLTSSASKSREIYLEFSTLNSETNTSKALRQFVNFLLVRPDPPREIDRSFSVNEHVNAFHNDGWWEGFIINVIPPAPASPDEPTHYSIYFSCSRELLVFPHTDIRLHREWVYGEWVPPLESLPPPPSLPQPPSLSPPPLLPPLSPRRQSPSSRRSPRLQRK